jgi:hypothetical protein
VGCFIIEPVGDFFALAPRVARGWGVTRTSMLVVVRGRRAGAICELCILASHSILHGPRPAMIVWRGLAV